MYNFEVEDWHTYFVTKSDIFVHNKAMKAKDPQKQSNLSIKGSLRVRGVGNPVKREGRGNTGRTIPKTLNEQMAMHQVQSNPLKGATNVPIKMTDPRWPKSEGWGKMQSMVKNADGTKTTVHYVYNRITGAFDDFKFSDFKSKKRGINNG